MRSIFSDLMNVLTLKPAGFEAINNRKNSVVIVFTCFAVIALLMTFGQVKEVSARVQRPDLVEFFEEMASRFDKIGQTYPRLLGEVMGTLSEKSQQVAEFVISMQAPLGKDNSLMIRAVGRWLQTPFNLLEGWVAAASFIFAITVLIGGKGSPREHIGIFLLAALPLSLGLLNNLSFLGGQFENIAAAIFIVAWLWSFAILVRGMAVVHKMTILNALMMTVFAFLIFELSLEYSLGKSLTQFIFGTIF